MVKELDARFDVVQDVALDLIDIKISEREYVFKHSDGEINVKRTLTVRVQQKAINYLKKSRMEEHYDF